MYINREAMYVYVPIDIIFRPQLPHVPRCLRLKTAKEAVCSCISTFVSFFCFTCRLGLSKYLDQTWHLLSIFYSMIQNYSHEEPKR